MGALLAFVASFSAVAAAAAPWGGADLGGRAGWVIFNVLALIACVSVHEFGHAWTADRLGDPLPRSQGRVTLNPIAHIDLLGTVIFPTLMALGVGIPLAWGKPVEWSGNPRYLTRRFSMRTIRFMVAVAGPGMNILLALLISLAFIVAGRLGLLGVAGVGVFVHLISLNLMLMFFNLLPLPPLDGRVFLEFLPDSLSTLRDFLMRYGAFVFLGLILIGGIGGTSPLSIIMSPFYRLSREYIGLISHLAF